MSKLMTNHTKTVSALGARAMVLGNFFDVTLPHLTTLQCAEVSRSFRQGIECAMSLTDDVALPAEYHSALLELTNSIVSILGKGSDRHNKLHIQAQPVDGMHASGCDESEFDTYR